MHPALAMILAAPLAMGAPVPDRKDAERMEKLFGKPVDPNKDCKFTLDGNKLVIAVPETTHALPQGKERMINAPRVMRDVKGNFRARVKVICKLPPSPPAGAVPIPLYTAGLLIYQDDDNYVVLGPSRSAIGRERLQSRVAAGRDPVSTFWGGSIDFDPHQLVWLEIFRNGNEVSFTASKDCKSWDERGATARLVGGREPKMDTEVKVGVFAEHVGGASFTATYEDFTVEPLAETKK
jgi:hypothetical protein